MLTNRQRKAVEGASASAFAFDGSGRLIEVEVLACPLPATLAVAQRVGRVVVSSRTGIRSVTELTFASPLLFTCWHIKSS